MTKINQDLLNTLPPVSTMMRGAGLVPKKNLGQNFLFDMNLTGRIARAVPDIEGTIVIEVGPGPGGLSRALLSAGARRVIAIEKDKSTAPILDAIAAASDGRFSVIYGDARQEIDNVISGVAGKVAICANLPYNIGTELLIGWLHDLSHIKSLTLMFQKEVAQRIIAAPRTEFYGRLSVLTALVADARILFNVPRTAFTPAPKVDSAVVQIVPKIENGKTKAEIESVGQLTAKLFGQRRKMIRGIIPNVDWSRFGLLGTERAEELSPEKFAEMAQELIIVDS